MHSRNSTDMPVRLAAEDLLFVIGSRHRLYGVTMDVGHLATEILVLP